MRVDDNNIRSVVGMVSAERVVADFVAQESVFSRDLPLHKLTVYQVHHCFAPLPRLQAHPHPWNPSQDALNRFIVYNVDNAK
jgi:hypothetical protein